MFLFTIHVELVEKCILKLGGKIFDVSKDVFMFMLNTEQDNRSNELVTHRENTAINLTLLIKFVSDTAGGPTNI